MALGDELAVLTACDDELYVLIGARALCVRTRTLLRKSVPQQVVPRSENIRERPHTAPTQRVVQKKKKSYLLSTVMC